MTADQSLQRGDGPGSVRRRLGLCLLLSLASAVLVYVACKGRGEFGDEGSYCLIGQGILRGGLPYRDLFNEKPPLQYFLTALTMGLTHAATLAGARVMPAVSLALTTLIILAAWIARRGSMLLAVGWTLFLAAAAIALSGFSDMSESTLAVLYTLAAFLVLAPGPLDKRPVATALGVGFLFGVACGFRQHALIPAAVALFMPQMRAHWRYMLLGLLAGVLSWAVVLTALGIGPDFLAATVFFHASNALVVSYVRGLDSRDIPNVLLFVATLVYAGVLLRRRRDFAWVLGLILAIMVPFFGRMDPFRLWPAMAVTCLALVLSMPDRPRFAVFSLLGLGAAAALVLLVAHPHPMTRVARAADLIAAHSAPNDTVWIGPFDPSLYCLSGRKPASKYYFVAPWTAKPDVLARLGQDLIRNQPRLIVDIPLGPYGLKMILPASQGLLDHDYHLLPSPPGMRIYERNGGAGPTAPLTQTVAQP